MPPLEAALRQHIIRASFKIIIWHASCLTKLYLLSPIEYNEEISQKNPWILSNLKETCQQIFFMISCIPVRGNYNIKRHAFVSTKTLNVPTYFLLRIRILPEKRSNAYFDRRGLRTNLFLSVKLLMEFVKVHFWYCTPSLGFNISNSNSPKFCLQLFIWSVLTYVSWYAF